MKSITKCAYSVILIFMVLMSTGVWAQTNVTFLGSVTRHAEIDQSQQVSGNIYFIFGKTSSPRDSSNSRVIPFTIPVGQASTTYQHTLAWSLAGSVDNPGGPLEEHDYFTIELVCTINCANSNTYNGQQNYRSNGETSIGRSDQASARFGEHQRDTSYQVDLILLPRATIYGTLNLPQGMRASADIGVKLVQLFVQPEFGNLPTVYYAQSDDITILAGQGRAAIKSPSPLTFFAQLSGVGLLCESKACKDHGLVEFMWLSKTAGIVNTNVSQFEPLGLVANSSSHSFRLDRSARLLKNSPLTVQVLRDSQQDLGATVSGTIIVEKDQNYLTCNPDFDGSNTRRLDLGSKTSACQDPAVISETKIVSETAFQIAAGMSSTDVRLKVEPAIQELTRGTLEHQRIRFVCRTGCEKAPAITSGFYRGGNSKYASAFLGGAQKFFLTPEFFANQIKISLIATPVLTPALILLLDD